MGFLRELQENLFSNSENEIPQNHVGPAPFANSKVKYMHTMEGKDDSLSFDFSGVK